MRYLAYVICVSAVLAAFNCEAKYRVDLDVTHISRTPLYPSYHGCVEYDEGGFNPRLNDDGKKITKTRPDEDEIVTYTAHIVNKGRKSSESYSYVWNIGDEEVSKNTMKPLKPGREVTVSVEWKWKSERTPIEFVVDAENKSGDEFEANNRRLIYSDAWQLLIYVHKNVYTKANSVKSLYGSYSFEDFIQHHIDVMNRKFADSKYPIAPEGCRARVAIDRFFIYKDDKELQSFMNDPKGSVVCHFYDGTWGFSWNKAEKGREQKNYADIFDKEMDWVLLHELGRRLGLIDYSNSDLYPCNNFVTGDDGYPIRIGHTACVQGMMRTYGDVLFSDLSVAALNAQVGKRRGFQGDYLFAVPEKNYIQVLDNMGKPISNAILRFYQSENSTVPDKIVFAGRTDENGFFLMPNRRANIVTTPNGFTQKPNPFGNIQTNGGNANMFFSITPPRRGCTEYHWIDLYTLNRAWFAGDKDEATFIYETSIGVEGAPKPPILDGDFLTQENLLLRWHKHPNFWTEYFNLYSREVDTGAFPYGTDTVDTQPFKVFMHTKQKKGIWDYEFKIEKEYYEFYLTSVGDFERESSPSRTFIAPSRQSRGKPITVTVDDESNIIYAADTLPESSNNWRMNKRRRFVSVFLSPPEQKYGDISDIIFHGGKFIATSSSQNCVFFYDRFGNPALAGLSGKEGSAPGEFKKPTGLAVHDKNIYVCDTGNDRMQVLTLDGIFVREFGQSGSGPGQFRSPSGIALASDGTIAVSDTGNDRVQLLKPDGEFIKELTGLKNPRGIDCYSDRFYIADTDNNRVLKTDKELNVIRTIEIIGDKKLHRPMDVWVHHYPRERRRRAFATLFIADYGSHLIIEDIIPRDEIERRQAKKVKNIKRAVAYGNFFDLDDPDTTLKPLQIVLSGLMDEILFTREWTVKLDNVPTGLVIEDREVDFIVDQYFQAFVDFKVTIPEPAPRVSAPQGRNYALASDGAEAEGFAEAELAIDGNGTDGYAHGIWRKPKPDSLVITLKKPVKLNRINVLLGEKDGMYYDYELEVSSDGKTWNIMPVSSSPNVIREISAALKKFNPNDKKDDMAHIALDYKTGYRGWTSHSIDAAAPIQYIRLTGKYNSANSSFQVVEVQAWGPESR